MTTTSYLAKFGINGSCLGGTIYQPIKPTEPIRPATDCDTCNNGCDCNGATGDLACGHWACWGRDHDAIVDCPSAAPLRDHMHAYAQYRRDLHTYEMSSHRTARR